MPHTPWATPTASDPVNATLTLPGSKSMTARALVIASGCTGQGRIVGPLHARDTTLMATGLRALGISISCDSNSVWTVNPPPIDQPLRGDIAIDVGLAGTAMRFLPPLAARARGPVRFDGDTRARQRPLGPLIAALRDMGITVDASEIDGLPLTIHGNGHVEGGKVTIDASSSSQLISGLLLSAATFGRGICVQHVGPAVPSAPHLQMTVDMLRYAGAVVDDSIPHIWTVEPGTLSGREWVIEPDLSGAAPFLAAALVTGGSVTVCGWPSQTTQPGDRLRHFLEVMGGKSELTPEGLTMRGGNQILGLDADLSEVGELTPVLVALAALASTPSRLRGIAHIRTHETDRIAALAKELHQLGAQVTELSDGLIVTPSPMRGGVVETYADHRMAHAAAVIGLAVPGIKISDISCTTKTMPEFPHLWLTLVKSPFSTMSTTAMTEAASETP